MRLSTIRPSTHTTSLCRTTSRPFLALLTWILTGQDGTALLFLGKTGLASWPSHRHGRLFDLVTIHEVVIGLVVRWEFDSSLSD